MRCYIVAVSSLYGQKPKPGTDYFESKPELEKIIWEPEPRKMIGRNWTQKNCLSESELTQVCSGAWSEWFWFDAGSTPPPAFCFWLSVINVSLSKRCSLEFVMLWSFYIVLGTQSWPFWAGAGAWAQKNYWLELFQENLSRSQIKFTLEPKRSRSGSDFDVYGLWFWSAV